MLCCSSLFAVVACFMVCLLSVQCFEYPESREGTFEGDIFYEKGERVRRNAVRSRRLLWPNGEVPYVMANSIKSRPSYVRAIKKAMEHWEQNTCIRFKKRKNERSYVYLFHGTGCTARVGASPYGGRSAVSLGPGCDDFGVAVHELGHSIGFYHEHNRQDRDKYIRVLWNNIFDGSKGAFNSRRLRRTSTTLGFPYDYKSVMHYGMYDMSKNGKPTILPLDPSVKTTGGRSLSPIDILQANVLYNCFDYPEFPKDFTWHTTLQNGQRCIPLFQSRDPGWRTKYLCYPILTNDLGIFRSPRRRYWRYYQCTKVMAEGSSKINYLCYPRDSVYQFIWSRSKYTGLPCLNLKDGLKQKNYYLCARKRRGLKLHVHGRWSRWSPWLPCSVKCGGGVRVSKRNCSTPQNGGKKCVGPNMRTIMCNIQACQPWPFWLSEFRFLGKRDAVPFGMRCITIFDKQDFRLCFQSTGRRDVNFLILNSSNETNMRCTPIPGQRESEGKWQKKNLCVPKSYPYSFQVSTDGPISGMRCLPFGKSLKGRENAHLCARTNFSCPAFWKSYRHGDNLYCYRGINLPQTWFAAQNSCKRLGANLVSITSAKENTFLLETFKNKHYWIGFTDRKREGTFEWVDKSPVRYTRWSSGDPDNGGANEDCAMLHRGSGKWNDWPCTTLFNPLCKVIAG